MKLGLLTLVNHRVQLESGSSWRKSKDGGPKRQEMAVFGPEKVSGRGEFPHEGEDTCRNYVCTGENALCRTFLNRAIGLVR